MAGLWLGGFHTLTWAMEGTAELPTPSANQGVVQDDPKLTLSPETEAYNQLPNCNPKEPDRTQELGRTQILPEGMWW